MIDSNPTGQMLPSPWLPGESEMRHPVLPTPVLRVVAAEKPAESMKRFTVDIPANLHRRVKVQCAIDGASMIDVIRDLLEKRFPDRP